MGLCPGSLVSPFSTQVSVSSWGLFPLCLWFSFLFLFGFKLSLKIKLLPPKGLWSSDPHSLWEHRHRLRVPGALPFSHGHGVSTGTREGTGGWQEEIQGRNRIEPKGPQKSSLTPSLSNGEIKDQRAEDSPKVTQQGHHRAHSSAPAGLSSTRAQVS